MLNIHREYLTQNDGWSTCSAYLRGFLSTAPVPFAGGILSVLRSRSAGRTASRYIAGLLVLETERKEPRRTVTYPGFELTDQWLSRADIVSLTKALETGNKSSVLGATFQSHASVTRIYTQSPYECATAWPETQALFRIADEAREPEHRPVVAYSERPHSSWKSAAMEWFRVHPDRLHAEIPYKHNIALVLPDRRGRIASVSLNEAGFLVVSAETGIRGPWQIAYSARRADRMLSSGTIAVRRNAAAVPLWADASCTDLWLVHRTAGPVSHLPVYHSELRPTAPPTAGADKLARSDVAGGESDTVEFKPFLRQKDYQDKLNECMKTVTAFANTRGGRVYVGVRDDCTLEGTQALCAAMGATPEVARTSQQLLFVKGVGDLVDPSPTVEYEWLSLGSDRELVLCISVPPSDDVHLYRDASVLVRRGSSNRMALGSELRELFRDRGATGKRVATKDELW